MSALALKADIHRDYGNACFVPTAGLVRCSKKKALFDQLVGARRAFEIGFCRMTRARWTALLTTSTVGLSFVLGTHERGRGRPGLQFGDPFAD
jgi:hypothetical protein